MTKKTASKKNKVNLSKLISDTIKVCEWVESWGNKESEEKKPETEHYRFNKPINANYRGVKTKHYNRIASHIKNYLYDSKRRKNSKKLALNTYHAYLSDIRRALMINTGFKHHSLEKNITKLIKRFPEYEGKLKKIVESSAESVKSVKMKVLSEVLDSHSANSEQLYEELRKVRVNHTLVDLLVKTKAQTAKRDNAINENLSNRKNNVIEVNFNYLKYLVNKLLLSDDFNDLALGVALATGRRAIEVIHTGKFTKTKSSRIIKFSGQAKKKHSTSNTSYEVPVIFDAHKIIKAVLRLRATEKYKHTTKDIQELSKTEQNIIINRRISRGLNSRIRELFNSPVITFKDSRAIAINVALEKIFPLKRFSKIDKNEFVKRYAGHDDYDSFKNYQHIRIDFVSPMPPAQEEELEEDESKCKLHPLTAITKKLAAIDKKGMVAVVRLHNRIIEALKEECIPLSVSSIYKGAKTKTGVIKIGGSRAVIVRYMDIPMVKRAIKKYHEVNKIKVKSL